MKISDEIRNWFSIDHCGSGLLVSKSECDRLLALADRIDAEMVELPRDRDGVPIHVGDTVYDESGVACEVVSIGFGRWSGGMMVHAVDGSHQWRDLIPGQLAHTRPDSFERIADELEEWSEDNRVNGDREVFDRAADFSERIRRLAKREDDNK